MRFTESIAREIIAETRPKRGSESPDPKALARDLNELAELRFVWTWRRSQPTRAERQELLKQVKDGALRLSRLLETDAGKSPKDGAAGGLLLNVLAGGYQHLPGGRFGIASGDTVGRSVISHAMKSVWLIHVSAKMALELLKAGDDERWRVLDGRPPRWETLLETDALPFQYKNHFGVEFGIGRNVVQEVDSPGVRFVIAVMRRLGCDVTPGAIAQAHARHRRRAHATTPKKKTRPVKRRS